MSCARATDMVGQRRLIHGRCLVALSTPAPFREGRRACRQVGGNLARVDNAATTAEASALLQARASAPKAWTGLHSLWGVTPAWSDDAPVTFVDPGAGAVCVGPFCRLGRPAASTGRTWRAAPRVGSRT
ncbi:MAG: hypothetical protein FJ137_11915 [Deltaproteobacteria bacterium]|nr:hypothetical protein [Deltaproteobacteria bacterium]